MNENKDIATMPYIVHEGELARSERVIRRLIVAVIVLAVILFLTNALWVYVTLHDLAHGGGSCKDVSNEACEVEYV